MMNENVRFEIKAEAFRRMHGILAPGKDQREGPSYEVRCKLWKEWLNKYDGVITAMLNAVEHIIGPDQEDQW